MRTGGPPPSARQRFLPRPLERDDARLAGAERPEQDAALGHAAPLDRRAGEAQVTACGGGTRMRHGVPTSGSESRHRPPSPARDQDVAGLPRLLLQVGPVDGETTRTRVFVATALAGAAHLVLDGLASRLQWTTPPYLLLDHASETFRDLLNLDRTTILVAVS